MKLNKKEILPLNINNIKNKFLNCSINNLKRGDYIQITFFIYDTKKKGGNNSRLNKITGILLKKKISYSNISILVSTMYKNEKVKWRFIVNSPQLICVNYLRKSLNQKKLISLAN